MVLFEDIHVEALMDKKEEFVLIDVRSPGEFKNATIPGSINIPLFDDEERKEIGILYKQASVQRAKEKGLEIVSRKLPAFVKEFERIPGKKVVFCWRGGMRSKTTATVLALMGIRVWRLIGGYRAYRRWVVDTLEHYSLQSHSIIINGYTGTNKTKILKQLSKEGYPVLDLEGMANHRGSIFGQIGLTPHNQKTFDSLLVHELLKFAKSPYILFEAESNRIGKVTLPPFLIRAKERGTMILLEMPLEERVKNIMEEYMPHLHQQACLEAFGSIADRIHTPVSHEIRRCLEEGRFEEAVRLLLIYYYDPRYEYAIRHYDSQPLIIRAENTEEALKAVRTFLTGAKGKSFL